MGVIGRLEMGKNLERTIEDMEVGETAYITPWSLYFDSDKTPYLNLRSVIRESSSETHKLKIKKTGDGLSDYQIDIRHIDHKWTKSADPLGNSVDSSKIVQLYYEDESEKEQAEEINESRIPYNQKKYPATWEMRKELNVALSNENYEYAAKLRDQINKSPEPLALK